MARVHPLSASGEVFLDARGGQRVLRVTWHDDADLVVLSLWRENICTGTFRLSTEEVPALIDLLGSGLDATQAVHRARRHQVS
jgi:hypothetical protein